VPELLVVPSPKFGKLSSQGSFQYL
jgi:predicted nuclease with TOPRIM domain